MKNNKPKVKPYLKIKASILLFITVIGGFFFKNTLDKTLDKTVDILLSQVEIIKPSIEKTVIDENNTVDISILNSSNNTIILTEARFFIKDFWILTPVNTRISALISSATYNLNIDKNNLKKGSYIHVDISQEVERDRADRFKISTNINYTHDIIIKGYFELAYSNSKIKTEDLYLGKASHNTELFNSNSLGGVNLDRSEIITLHSNEEEIRRLNRIIKSKKEVKHKDELKNNLLLLMHYNNLFLEEQFCKNLKLVKNLRNESLIESKKISQSAIRVLDKLESSSTRFLTLKNISPEEIECYSNSSN